MTHVAPQPSGWRAFARSLGGVLVSDARLVRPARVTRAGPAATQLDRGVALRGTVWPGAAAEPYDGVVVVDRDGRIAALGPARAVRLPYGLRTLGDPGCWI